MLSDEIIDRISSIVSVARAVAEKIRAEVKQAEPTLRALLNFDWPALIRVLDELPAKSRVSMELALKKGWFFGWCDTLQGVVELIEKLDDLPEDKIDEVMIDYYRSRFKTFSDELIDRYVSRANAIGAAVNAHLNIPNTGFLLSVPVFIAQADGILGELTGMEMGIAHGPAVVDSRYATDAKARDLLCSLIELKKSDFALSSKKRGPAFKAFNRHQIMHGERSDYGNEVNSLKAFSFLVFVGLHLPLILESYPVPE